MKTSAIFLVLLSRTQLLEAAVQKDVVLLLRIVELVPLRPVVAGGVGEDLAPGGEGRPGDRLLHLLRGLQLGAGVLVPEGVAAVGADGGQRAVLRVEGDVVHHEDVLEVVVGAIGAVALEGEVVLRIGRTEVLNGDAALDAADGEAGRRVVRLLAVGEDGDAAVLVLQRRLDLLELADAVFERVDDDGAIRQADHRHRVLGVGAVALLGEVHRHAGIG